MIYKKLKEIQNLLNIKDSFKNIIKPKNPENKLEITNTIERLISNDYSKYFSQYPVIVDYCYDLYKKMLSKASD